MKKHWIVITSVIAGLTATMVILGATWGQTTARAARPSMLSGSPLAPAATLTVTSTADSGPGTLRQAILEAVDGDTITFDTAIFSPTHPATITLAASGLPAIITDALTLDGSAAGVVIDGSNTTTGTHGLVIDGASGVIIKGLQILSFPEHGIVLMNNATSNAIGGPSGSLGACTDDCNLISGNGGSGVEINGSGTTSNTVEGNFIGTDLGGTTAVGNDAHGVHLNDASLNRVAGNLIGGNVENGVAISGSGATGNTVTGNRIGTTAEGTAALANHDSGISIWGGPSFNTIGGAGAGEGNLIGGNDDNGVELSGLGTNSNTLHANLIGTNVTGTVPLPNGSKGVLIENGASHNTIGGNTAGERNLISGNSDSGIGIDGSGTGHNTVSGNFIGTDVSGTAAVANSEHGVWIGAGASTNLVGGDNATPGGICSGACNLIGGNGSSGYETGVWIEGTGTTSNTVSGNYIGTNLSGTVALGNLADGIRLSDGPEHTVIGGSTPAKRNLISGNGGEGIELGGAHYTLIAGNYVGTDASGTLDLGNQGRGMGLNDAGQGLATTWNVITGNLISGNHQNGMDLYGPDTTNNIVSGNRVGTDVTGQSALPNDRTGVWIGGGAHDNLIGGDNGTPGGGCTADCNLVSGNGTQTWDAGISLFGSTTTSNTVSGNYIGTNLSGTTAISNIGPGLSVVYARHNTVGGSTPAERNLLSGNGDSGVSIWEADHNRVTGNYVGVDTAGTTALPNTWQAGDVSAGVVIDGSSSAQHNQIGGSAPGEGNVISGNEGFGVRIGSPPSGPGAKCQACSYNTVAGNTIGVGADGVKALGNQWVGIVTQQGGMTNTIGGPTEAHGNLIAHNGGYDGLHLQLDGTGVLITFGPANTISHNSIYSHTGSAIVLRMGGNQFLFRPLLTEVTTSTVKGLATANATIEIYSDDGDEARWFQGSTVADGSGHFTFTSALAFTGTQVTATATDGQGNTSELSSPYTPKRDVLVAAIFVPHPEQGQGIPFTPTVRVANGGTGPETFTVTAVITRAGARVYEDQRLVTNLGALTYRSLTFTQWSTTTLGGFTFDVSVDLGATDDDPSNDRATRSFNVVEYRVDLWSRDNLDDDGQEPTVGPIWQSPDLWVRNVDDGIYAPQDPINNITNTVYMRMRNRGTLTATEPTVTVYWHPPALVIGQSWWEPIGTVTVAELAPGMVYTISLPWRPQVTSVMTEPYHTCLIDVISSTQDPAPLWWDVGGSNNIEQRNVDIVSTTTPSLLQAAADTAVESSFSVGNPYPGEQLVDVILDSSGLPSGTEVRLDLGFLFDRWQDLGVGQLTGATVISDTTQISFPGGGQATITGLPLAGEELFEITMQVYGLGRRRGQVDVSERIGGEVLGGLTLLVDSWIEAEIYLPLVMRSN